MKSQVVATLSIAALSLALAVPEIAHARNPLESVKDAQGDVAAPAGKTRAMQMVPARAALMKDLDAKKMKSGSQFQAKLVDKVHLKNGEELPSGTMLMGTVVADSMQTSGVSRLALRFTSAKLKNGDVVPIKATIVGIAAPEPMNGEGYDVPAGDQASNDWSNNLLQFDVIGAVSGVDLHSKIASDDSGTFVSTKKHDVKLDAGTEIALAVGALS